MATDLQNNKAVCQHCRMVDICTHSVSEGVCVAEPLVKQSQQLKRKELLYSYRDDFKCIYAVQTGAIKTFQVDVNGQERIHHFYLPGELIGLEAIHAGFYPYSAIALTQTVVCEVPFNNLLDFVAGYPELQRNLIMSLSRNVNQGDYVTAPTAEQRTAAFILDIAKRIGGASGQLAIELPMSRYDIGNYLGLAPETVSRIFTRFQQANFIQVQNKKITLIDQVNLKWMAQEGC